MDLTKALIEYELDQYDITPKSNLTNTGLLNTIGWRHNNHGLWVKEEACKSDYILFQTKSVNTIYKHYKNGKQGRE